MPTDPSSSAATRETLAEAIDEHLRSIDWQTDPAQIAASVADFLIARYPAQRFLEDRYGHLWLMATDHVLIEWSPRARDYIESTKGPLTEWSDPSADA